MKYVLYTPRGSQDERYPGLLHNNGVIDLNFILKKLDVRPVKFRSIQHLIEHGQSSISIISKQSDILDSVPDSDVIPLDQVRLRAPLFDAKKLILLAGNYAGHIREVGYKVPPSPESISPQFFMKPPSTTIIDPESQIHIAPKRDLV